MMLKPPRSSKSITFTGYKEDTGALEKVTAIIAHLDHAFDSNQVVVHTDDGRYIIRDRSEMLYVSAAYWEATTPNPASTENAHPAHAVADGDA